MNLTIQSGGQTGADRAALDWAIVKGVPHRGWCPLGRQAEDGTLPEKYLLEETTSTNYAVRTKRNIQDSDGTVIISIELNLDGGSHLTQRLAQEMKKPVLHLHGQTTAPGIQLRNFIEKHRLQILNIAGPRASREPNIYNDEVGILDSAFSKEPD